jgi:hypothetical protein
MYVCMYVCMCVCVCVSLSLCDSLSLSLPLSRTQTHTLKHIYILYIYIYVYMYVYVFTYRHTHIEPPRRGATSAPGAQCCSLAAVRCSRRDHHEACWRRSFLCHRRSFDEASQGKPSLDEASQGSLDKVATKRTFENESKLNLRHLRLPRAHMVKPTSDIVKHMHRVAAPEDSEQKNKWMNK